MQKFKVELLPSAWDDLQEISNYLSLKDIELADRVTGKIIKSLRILENFPNSGAYVPDNELRKNNFRMIISSPYISFYRFIDEVVFIYHIVHGAKEYSSFLKSYIRTIEEQDT